MKFAWRQPGGLPECPYFYRWVVDFGPFSLRLHKWLSGDDPLAFHDHPHWFITVMLWGCYCDNTPDGQMDVLKMGSIRFRRADYKHHVMVLRKPTWTFLITGRHGRRWSFYERFYENGQRVLKAMKRDKYFAERGHHPCDPIKGTRVRMRPDGTRI